MKVKLLVDQFLFDLVNLNLQEDLDIVLLGEFYVFIDEDKKFNEENPYYFMLS